MNATPKTDECIKMLGEAQIVFTSYYYKGDRHFDDDDKSRLIDFQNRIKAMLCNRLLPIGVITMLDDADKETARTNPILQNVGDFEAFWYVMKNYQLITTDDLKNEFWEICPNLESIPGFLDAMNVKFENVNYGYDTDIDKIKKHYNGVGTLVELGKVTEKEADAIYWNIHFIAERYNFVMSQIREIYKTFRKMAEPHKVEIVEPQQITISDTVLNELEKERLITKEPLKWIGAKNLCAYFVDGYFKSTTNKWETGKKLFGVGNLAQLKDLYENNKSGKPKNYKIIDNILSDCK